MPQHPSLIAMEGEVDFKAPGTDKPCKTWYKVFGDLSSGRRPLVALHGGPGAVHDYLLTLTDLTKFHGIPLVLYDQLGNGRSTHLPEKRGDATFWTDNLFIAELENLLEHLGIQDDYDLYGHSWGGMLGGRFAIRQPPGLKRLIIANAPVSIDLWIAAANRLKTELPLLLQATIDRHEAEGTTDDKEYQQAVMCFYGRYVCRVSPWPAEVSRIFESIEEDPTVYSTMIGPSEFFITGSLRNWSLLGGGHLHKIKAPTLLLNGKFDEAQDSVMCPFFRDIPNVEWHTFKNSSHMPHHEERDQFMDVVSQFLLKEIPTSA
ncbi:proline-specific peptidase [Trametes sanguinea]|nr:proline-specific peptidase [Trametes sanguinea]